MKKDKLYRGIRFDAKSVSAADRHFKSLFSKDARYLTLRVGLEDEDWFFDKLEEFLAAGDSGKIFLHEISSDFKFSLSVTGFSYGTSVTVEAPSREEIESVFAVFDEDVERCRVPEEAEPAKPSKVFIGHGLNPQWRDLKDHLHEKHGYSIEAYEIGSREGHTIRDILEDMLDESSVALLVMTGEDATDDGSLRARQNVVHEAGLFQGRLGFSRAIILLEEGTEEFSNIHGLQQIRFSKDKIKESFGDVLAFLKREIGLP